MCDGNHMRSSRIECADGLHITVFERDGGEGTACGYATRIWDCSVGLARWMLESLLESPERPLRGRRVLELGAGTALCSLAIVAAEPDADVTATDVDPAAMPLIAAAGKAASQGLRSSSPRAALLDICASAADAPLPACDLLLACDACYTPQLAAALARRPRFTLEPR